MSDGDTRKREADEGENGESKRFRGDDFVEKTDLRFLIGGRSAGPIIGRAGANIKQMRDTYNAKVSIPDAPGDERLLMVSAAREHLFDLIAAIGRALKEGPRDPPGPVEMRLLVHQSQAGCVIGRAGSKVKELREKYSCGIKVFSKTCPRSTERVVSVSSADEENVANCFREVLELLDSAPPRGPNQLYDPQYFDVFEAEEYGGYGDPRGQGGMRPDFDRGPRGPPMRGGMRGGFDGGSRMDNMGRGGFGGGMGPSSRGPPPPMRSGGGGGSWQGGGGGGRGGDEPSGDVTTTQVTIPKDLAGAIIGRGGSRIRQIRAESKAMITIDEAPPGATDRIINIRGTHDSIQHAQHLLQQSVKQNTPSF